MNLFDTIIVQPIFNVLIAIYGLVPGHDFGVSLIIFTVLIRLIMWPLVKKQLHQTRVMRKLQPEIKKLKVKAKGNKQLESQMMLELYRERGVNPFSSIGVLIVQLPVFIALYRVIQIITTQRDKIEQFTYGFLQQLEPVKAIIIDKNHEFNESLLNLVSLTNHAIGKEGVYVPLLILAALAAVLQYVQSKQITPQASEGKKLRDYIKDSTKGKSVDQGDISALMSQRMIVIFPVITFLVAIYLPGALVLYYAASSGVAVIQQHMVLSKDVEEMEAVTPGKKEVKAETVKRVEAAEEATVVTTPKKKAKNKKRKQR